MTTVMNLVLERASFMCAEVMWPSINGTLSNVNLLNTKFRIAHTHFFLRSVDSFRGISERLVEGEIARHYRRDSYTFTLRVDDLLKKEDMVVNDIVLYSIQRKQAL